MEDLIVQLLIGLVLVVLGISNMRGNINSLHWYHRRRVSEADRPAFGRLVGLGTIIVGVGVMLYALLNWALPQFTAVFSALLIAFIVIGLGLNFYAMFKYNKGIF